MTLRAVTTGCNQSTSRDPVVDYPETLVERTLGELKGLGLVRMVHPGAGERSTKYRQVADEALGLDGAGCALLCVLALRGPQTAAELKARTERIHHFDSTGAAEEALHALADHPRRLAVQLDRLPGHKERRWAQLLTATDPGTAQPSPAATAPSPAGTDATAATTAPPAPGTVADLTARLAAAEARLDRLETALADLLGEPSSGPADDPADRAGDAGPSPTGHVGGDLQGL